MLIDYTKNQFINHNIFLGCNKKQTIESSYNYLLGFRKKISIIKISISILFCKQIYNFLSQLFSKYGSLWFNLIMFKNYKLYKIELFTLIKKFNISFFDQKFRIFFLITKWKPGCLTNYNSWRQTQQNIFNYFWYPNSIFQINIIYNSILQFEPTKVGIIGMNIIDTCIPINKKNYIIVGNEKTIISLLFYYKIIINFILRNFILQQINFILKK